MVVAFALTFVVSSVYAAGKVRVSPQSIGYVRMGKNADGSTRWVTKAEWAAWFDSQMAGSAATGAAEYVTTTGALSSSTIGGLARKAIRGGVYGAAIGLAVDGVLQGAGWAIGELQDQVISPGTPAEPLGEAAYCISVNSVLRCSSAPGQLAGIAHLAAVNVTQPCAYKANTWYSCTLKSNGTMYESVKESIKYRPTTGWGSGYQNDNPSTPASTITDEQLGDAIRKDPGLVSSLLTDPRTGRPVMTPELQQQGDDLKKRLEEREGYDPSDPSTAPDLDDDTANDDGSPWPTFCGWATSVCDFITWFKTDDSETESPEVPWEDEAPSDYEQSWSSGLGGGSCPSAVTFTVALGGQSASPEFSFEGLCRFATMMRPVIIALASIIAGFIIAGVRGTKDA